ncbi:hypothetical protein BCh11DRAFT_03920 [Burkholderia sp. Ch1-1]|nr:hypothetical protein BCh11DRAFT_03920 [Burkholderia sp. Ch1-1]
MRVAFDPKSLDGVLCTLDRTWRLRPTDVSDEAYFTALYMIWMNRMHTTVATKLREIFNALRYMHASPRNLIARGKSRIFCFAYQINYVTIK